MRGPHLIETLKAALAGRYEIQRELGHGGMATIYLARDERHERMVAVKILRADFAASLGAGRFLREIRIAANLQHPHILTLIDSGSVDDALYYVMPFADGMSLRDRLAGTLLPVSEVVRYLRDIFDALSYAHGQGVVHRDIKPDNVMLSGRHALVVDFGIAKAVSAAQTQQSGTANSEPLTQVGTSIGTPAYMAPEQAAADPDVSYAADLYAVGVVAYEMLAGHPPFTGSSREILAAHLSRAPESIAVVAPHTPTALATLVMRCLEKDPAHRYSSALEALEAIESLSTPDSSTAATRQLTQKTRKAIAAIGAAAAIIVGVAAFKGYEKLRDDRWAHSVALPEIRRLAEANRFDSAFILATRAEKVLGNDSTLESLWGRVSARVTFTSMPSGASVFRSAYEDSVGWIRIGVTPTDSVRIPIGISRYRFELPGHHPVQMAGGQGRLENAQVVFQRMDSSDGLMVHVTGGRTELTMPGLSRIPAVRLPAFYIDRHEVTNEEYGRFVRAGGYTNASHWEIPIVQRGRTLSFTEAQRVFVDRTGRAGPAGWEGGDFPTGQDQLPVGGVSWYEAAAYAKFTGKSLPSIYHWNRAASRAMGALIIPGSNYGGRGPTRGSTFRGMSASGAFDMAGNVREWTWNATGDKRFILGGGWTDGSYAFSDAYAQEPLDRSLTNGIRLVRAATAAGLGPPQINAAIVREERDYNFDRPVSDAVYQGFASFYDYDRTPLNARVDSRVSTSEFWIRERVTFDAAYGGERMAAVIFIPRQGKPPYQTAVVMGGSNYLYTQSDSAINERLLDYVVKGGRMVVWPIFKGMFERNVGLENDSPEETSAYRDLMVMMVKDARRTVDYLVTRPDVDSSRLAYVGFSFGGRVSPPILATESRFKAAVLVVAGLKMERARAEVDPINFLPRVRLPLIMLNGRHDFYFPVETSQKPFFEYLGTPHQHRRWVVYPEAHTVPRTESVRETMAWLDRYLGPVQR